MEFVCRVAVEGMQQENYDVVFPTPFSKVRTALTCMFVCRDTVHLQCVVLLNTEWCLLYMMYGSLRITISDNDNIVAGAGDADGVGRGRHAQARGGARHPHRGGVPVVLQCTMYCNTDDMWNTAPVEYCLVCWNLPVNMCVVTQSAVVHNTRHELYAN